MGDELCMLHGTSVDTLLAGGHIANQQDLEAIEAWCKAKPELFPESCGVSVHNLRWAASVVASRAFDSTKVGVVLAPFADALNHSGARPHTRMHDMGNALRFIAERDIPGEEVLNTYGEHGNTQWLLNGGFVDTSGPYETFL